MTYECTICGSETALTGSCRGCGCPAEVEGQYRRRPGKSELKRLQEECDKLRRELKLAHYFRIHDDAIDQLTRELEQRSKDTFLEALAGDACSNIDQLKRERDEARIERDAYRAMIVDLLESAHPHPVEHPAMSRQWQRARDLLKNGPRP